MSLTPEQAAIRPKAKFPPVEDVHARAVLDYFKVTEQVAVIGIRGYIKQFPDAHVGENLIGKYDDVICVVTPTECRTYLANTDPTRLITDPATKKGRAQLVAPGKYRYMRGVHGLERPKDQQRMAWVQAGGVTIRRWDDKKHAFGDELKDQWIGLNIHDGSWTTTGSAACQTIVPEEWKAFDGFLLAALQTAHQERFWYCVTI